MSIRMRNPETVKLDLSNGDWLLVKKYLNAGEQKSIFSRSHKLDGGRWIYDGLQYPTHMVAEYLIDWSFDNADGTRIVITGDGTNGNDIQVKIDALDSLPADDFQEVREAVSKHAAAVEQALAEEKKRKAGASASSVTSISRKRSAGAMNG